MRDNSLTKAFTALLLLISCSSFGGEFEIFPRKQRYYYSAEDTKFSRLPNIETITLKEYNEMLELLNEDLRQKWPTYDIYLKETLYDWLSENILHEVLNVAALNHRIEEEEKLKFSFPVFDNLISMFSIDQSLSAKEKVQKLKEKGVLSGREFFIPHPEIKNFKVALKLKKITLNELVSSIPYLQNTFRWSGSFGSKSVEDIFTEETENRVKFKIKKLISDNTLLIFSDSDNKEYLISLLAERIFLKDYFQVISMIDAHALKNLKKHRRDSLLKDYVVKEASSNLRLTTFMEASHLDLVYEYLKGLPNSPFIKDNLKINGWKVRCEDKCQDLKKRYETEGASLLENLVEFDKTSFTFSKFPQEDQDKEKIKSYFMNPINSMQMKYLSFISKDEIYFLESVDEASVFIVDKNTSEAKKLIMTEYEAQKQNIFLFDGLSSLLRNYPFDISTSFCLKGVCIDSFSSSELLKRLLIEVKSVNGFKIFRPSKPLISTLAR
ncbi:MAG: hypothetical protein CME61_03380 [Halobacteriovoraceae bacterium]|nr:hypothetical protein [Halobacteriovoraceae bacterium]